MLRGTRAAISRAMTLQVGPFMVLIGLLFANPALVTAQDTTDRDRWWLGVGIGGGDTPDDTQITSTLLQATYQKAGHQLSARFPFLQPRHTYERGFKEYGVTYGRVLLRSSGHLSASTGLSYVNACTGFPEPASLPDECVGRWGVPLVAEGALHIGYVGVGIQAFANLNRAGTYTGVLLFLQAGRLR